MSLLKNPGQCPEMDSVLQPILQQQSEFLKSAQDLWTRLQNLPQKKTLLVLGVESSEEENRQSDSNPDNLLSTSNLAKANDLFEVFMQQCPTSKDQIWKFKLIMLMPQNIYALEQNKMGFPTRLQGVDDAKLRAQSFTIISPETRHFNIEKERNNYSPESYLAIKQIVSDFIQKSEIPSGERIGNILNSIDDPELKEQTQKFLAELQQLAFVAAERNQKIAANVIAIGEDTTLIIGDAHLEGLKSEFLKSCQAIQ